MKIPLVAGFKDPVRRPRYIIWTGVGVILFATLMIVAMTATSGYWFCANVCHKVQDDAVYSYDVSAHSEISCYACHMPLSSDPVTFMIHKIEAGILGLLHTLTDTFIIPINGHSHYAMTMPEEQCTQCHSEHREITPGPGIIIDHKVHSEHEVACTMCHNRVSHPEWKIEITNKDPQTGILNPGHDNFMEMTGCCRCHSLEADAVAPGRCSACHPADFELKPPSHFEEGFFPGGHAELALEDIESVAEAVAHSAHGGGHGDDSHGDADHGDDAHEEETHEEDAAPHDEEETHEEDSESEEETHEAEPESEEETPEAEPESDDGAMLGIESAYASGHENKWSQSLTTMGEVGYCSTCHLDSFCENCHGMEMPHPEKFVKETHPDAVKTQVEKCEMCHHQSEATFCDDCHHGTASNWEFSADEAWHTQHAKTVVANGVDGCLENCHVTQFCSDCHTELQPVPSSHAASDWLRKPLKEIGVHAESFTGQPTSCEICHGEKMPNDNAFCRSCHVLEVPHETEFRGFHSKTGRDNPEACANCHTFKELCSDCHHEGSIDGKPWLNTHGGSVNEAGAGACFEKCHDQDFCVACHTAKVVVPISHKQAAWTYRQTVDAPALHPTTYGSTPENCGYCHGTEPPNDNKFCRACHALDMPHPDGFKDTHKAQFDDSTLKKAMCTKCHAQIFCDTCHHTGAVATKPWRTDHPRIVSESGAGACLDTCHEPTFCAYCHVNEVNK